MTHRQHIAEALREYLGLTQAEHRAIRAGDWTALRTVQNSRTALRLRLGRHVEQWRVENPGEAAANPFANEISELMAMQTQNANMLIARRHRLDERKRHLEQARFNLRRVQSSYAAQQKLAINSYS